MVILFLASISRIAFQGKLSQTAKSLFKSMKKFLNILSSALIVQVFVKSRNVCRFIWRRANQNVYIYCDISTVGKRSN